MHHDGRPPVSRTVSERIERYNRGREAERLAIKYARMRADVFTFLRGTAHLFYEDLPARSPLNAAPASWICGDLHLENFGGYTAADGREYFDVCDFDEAAIGPVSWELARLCVSLLLAGRLAGMSHKAARQLMARCLDGYAAAWSGKPPRPIDRAVAQPDLRRFLRRLSSARPDAFLRKRVAGKGRKRRLKMIKGKTLPAHPGEKRQLKRWWTKQARQPELASCGELLDVARRITGTGSLGLHRYALLVDNDRGMRLLELKEAVGASLIRQQLAPATPWKNDARRIVAVQTRMQVARRGLLTTARVAGRQYILRELHPGDDKLTVARGGGAARLMRLARWLGRAAAASHRRGAGWRGAASAGKIAAFVAGKKWRQQVLDYALAYKRIVERDWRAFRKATSARKKRT